VELGLPITFLFLAKSHWLGAFTTVNSDAVVVDISDTAAVDEVVGMQFSLSASQSLSASLSDSSFVMTSSEASELDNISSKVAVKQEGLAIIRHVSTHYNNNNINSTSSNYFAISTYISIVCYWCLAY